MTIQTECRSCGKKYRVSDQMSGKRIPCKECGETIRVPAVHDDDDDILEDDEAPSRKARSRRRKSGVSGATIALIAVGVVGILVVGGGIWGAVMVLRPSSTPPQNGQDGFAPGGVATTTLPASQPLGAPGQPTTPAGSRFDTPVTKPSSTAGSTSSNSSRPALTNNSQMGIGFGNIVGIVSSKLKSNSSHARDNEFATLKESPDALPPDIWTIQPDPPKETLVFEPEKKTVRVKVPLAGKRITNQSMVFPVVPSPYVAVGSIETKKDIVEIWNLCQGRKVSKIANLALDTEDVALSPDGRYYAAVAKSGSGSTVGIYDIEDQTALGNFELEHSSRHVAVAMPRPNLLLAMNTWSDRTIQAWELPSGTIRYEIKLGHRAWFDFPPVFSPGGKYLAWLNREGSAELIGIYDLDDGQLVGQMSLPEYDIGWWLHVHGLAFSHDGTELAAIIDGHTCSKILIYSMKTGEIIDHATFPKKLQEVVTGNNSPWNSFNPLVYFPGNQRLLAFEHGVIDRRLGELVWNVPRSGVDFAGKRFPLDESHLTVIDVGNNAAAVFVYELPETKIEQATEKIAARTARQEGAPSTVGRVNDTAFVDESQAKFVATSAGSWSLKPDMRNSENGKARPTRLRPATGAVTQFAVSGGASPKAAVMRTTSFNWGSRIPQGNTTPQELKSRRQTAKFHDHDDRSGSRHVAGFGSGRSRNWLDVYDLGANRHERQIRLMYQADLIGLSPDGTRALLWAASEQDRLDVYDTTSGTHLVSWQPQSREWSSGSFLTGARFLDADRVCTLTNTGQLDVFHLPAAGSADRVQKVLSAWNASQPAVSPTGQYLGYSDGQAYHIVEVSTGEPKAKIPDVGDVQGVAFHPRHGRLALMSEYQGGYYLFTADLASGTISPPFPVPVISPFLQWFGDHYVLLDNSKLVDVEQKVVAWTYELPEGDHLPSSDDDRHWYLAGSGDSAQPQFTLSSVELPTKSDLSQLQGAVLQPEFVLQPGDKCSVTAQLGPHSSYAEEARKLMIDGLKKHKISVEQGQPVTLELTVTEKTGGLMEQEFTARFGGGSNQKVSVTQKTATCRAQFRSGGVVAWEQEFVIGNYIPMFITTKENQSIAQVIEEDYQNAIKGVFHRVKLPPFVFTPKAANGIGTTVLTASGG